MLQAALVLKRVALYKITAFKAHLLHSSDKRSVTSFNKSVNRGWNMSNWEGSLPYIIQLVVDDIWEFFVQVWLRRKLNPSSWYFACDKDGQKTSRSFHAFQNNFAFLQ